MFTKTTYAGTLLEQYATVTKQLDALCTGEPDAIANYSNAAALLNTFLDDINWVGFYFMKDGELVLGPFQGLPACVRIPVGRGVCGTAVATKQTQLVKDVHAFPGHIACDGATNSEVVVPLIHDGEVIGVLDIDSPSLARFTEDDVTGLTQFVETLLRHV
ncbi:GAF domain-containing protein [Caryophanon latum]|uniref:GAF domain-containing protein n=1 Tax=Caryophanon latum TaxID=33977 RepID=A0A1C0YRA4_9BACL|nr:GAF domain-containing protein [Caryophanon latum]OCS89696.1 GAF domain-containing protein [Caryophanon latum]